MSRNTKQDRKRILESLIEQPGQTVAQLARSTGMTKPEVYPAITSLDVNRFVERTLDNSGRGGRDAGGVPRPLRRRKYVYHITPAGQRALLGGGGKI